MVKNLPDRRIIGDVGSIPGLGRSPGEGNGSPLQYSFLGNSLDRESCRLQSIGLQSQTKLTTKWPRWISYV